MVLFFGPPGAGKSVQGKFLVERNGWQWLSTGELFRSSKDPEVLERLKSGELIDDELTNKVLEQALKDIGSDTHIVLDGYPRNVAQAKWLAANLPKYGRSVACIIVFEVTRDELIKRLSSRGRAEDTTDVIARRLDIYEEQTKPVLDFYETTSTPLKVIDGNGTMEDVYTRTQSAVNECLRA